MNPLIIFPTPPQHNQRYTLTGIIPFGTERTVIVEAVNRSMVSVVDVDSGEKEAVYFEVSG